ncbi:MAG TPA: hypothetical protein ENJ00_05090 [Phycisphaerales bacterium]|nr:hypothetical protein [Phycisphaerales bacterium]
MKRIHALVMGSLLWCSPAPAPAQPSFVTLGDLPGGDINSVPSDLSTDGSVVVGTGTTSGGLGASLGAFRWTRQTGLQPLGSLPGGLNSGGNGVSPNGSYVTGQTSFQGTGSVGWVWSEASGIVSIGTLPTPGRAGSSARQVFDDGMVLGRSAYGIGDFGTTLVAATVWTPETGLRALPLPNGDFNAVAVDRLADGRIVGSSSNSSSARNWFYSEDTGFEFLEDISGSPLTMTGFWANDDGTLVFGHGGPTGSLTTGAAYWTPEEGERYLPGFGPTTITQATGLTDDASLVVGFMATFAGQVSETQVVWLNQGDADTPYNYSDPIPFVEYVESMGVDLEGWRINEVRGVSGDGTTFIGTASPLTGPPGIHIEAFVLTIPTPASLALPGLSMLALGRRRRGPTGQP